MALPPPEALQSLGPEFRPVHHHMQEYQASNPTLPQRLAIAAGRPKPEYDECSKEMITIWTISPWLNIPSEVAIK